MRPARAPEPLHRLERRLEHAVERAAPAGVRGADHPRLGVAAAAPARSRRSGRRARAPAGRSPSRRRAGRSAQPSATGDRHVARNGPGAATAAGPGRDAERRGDARAVQPHRLGLVARARAAVQPRVDARRGAAAAREEAVARAGQQVGGQDLKRQRLAGSSVSNPGGGATPAGMTAIALKSVPISAGSVKRRSCPAIAAATACGAPARQPRRPARRSRAGRGTRPAAPGRRRAPARPPRASARKRTWAVRSASPGASSGSADAWRAHRLQRVAGPVPAP